MKKIILIALLIIIAIFTVRTSYMYSIKQATTGTPISASSSLPQLQRNLQIGDSGSDVSLLQNFLVQQGFMNDVPTGNYGSSTYVGVSAFQVSKGITPVTGQVSVLTRLAINQILASESSVATSTDPDVSTTTDPTVDPIIEGCGKGVTVGTTVFKLENCTISSNGQDVIVRIIPSDLSAAYSYRSLTAGFPKQGLLASAEGKSKQGVVTMQIPVRDFGISTVTKKARTYTGFVKIQVSLDGKKNAPKYLYQKISVTIRP